MREAGVSLAAVQRWLSDRGFGDAPLEQARLIGGGTQNVMLAFRHGDRDLVLRRGPVHLRRWSNTAILRETRVLQALGDTDVPHARLVAVCDDADVLDGAVFYLMERVEGFNAGLGLPPLHAESLGVRREMGWAIVDALASLGRVDHVAAGLEDFGKPEGFLDRQPRRWLDELASYAQYDGYPGPTIGDVTGVADWLTERVPASWTPGLMHGDFHASNVMFALDGPEVTAIVDWEMSTIGDPLLDLGWLLATWRLPGAPAEFAGSLMTSSGLATGVELAERYALGSSRDLEHLRWYTVLACFKLGILLEGSHARMYAGQASREIGEALHQTTLSLFDRAHELMHTSSSTPSTKGAP